MAFHRNLVNDDIHALTARVYASIADRDADVLVVPGAGLFQVTANVNKMVRVDSPLRYYMLTSVAPVTWDEVSNAGKDEFLDLLDTPSVYSGDAGKVAQVNAGETALEFGQALRTIDSPTFAVVTVGDTGLVVGASAPFSDAAGVLTLQNVDAIDATTKAAVETAITGLANLVSVQGQSISLSGPLTVEAVSVLNQDLTTDANPTFNDLTLTGNLLLQGDTFDVEVGTMRVEDKNIELAVGPAPSDVLADGGGITLKGTTDKTIEWRNATNRWTFNQGIDLQGNNLISAGGLVSAEVIAGDNVLAGNLQLSGNTLSSITGDIDFVTDTGGVFKFNSNSLRAGQGANDYIELGHNGVFSFISAFGIGGLEFAIDGSVKARFTEAAGHLQLVPSIDQKDVLTLRTFDNLKETGIAWQNRLPLAFTHAIYREDVGSNRADLTFAAGLNSNIDLLTPAFKILGGDGVEGNLQIFGALQILSGSPALGKFLTTDALGNTTWGIPNAGAGGWLDDGAVVRLTDLADQVGIGITTPHASAKLEVFSVTQGFLLPRMTTVQRDAIVSPATGLKIYNTTVNKDEIYTGAIWKTLLTEDIGQIVAQESFASNNVRYFGELGLPGSQSGWSETGTGIISLFSDIVFGVTKDVVKHFSTTANSTKSESPITGADWDNILAFGGSFSGITRITEDINTNSIFAGVGFSSANDPRPSSIESRTGIFISVNATHTTLLLDGTATVILDGTGGKPLVLKDEWMAWEAVIKPTPDAGVNFGVVDVYVNNILVVTGAIVSSNNAVSDEVSLANSSGSGQTTFYVDNFGITIFEESATKTLLASTMSADVAQVNIPEGKRDYTIVLPDGSPRIIGAVLRLVATNVGGSIELKNENLNVPEILYNGLRELTIDILAKETIDGINTVNLSNVYIGFKAESTDKSIGAQLSSSVDQEPTNTNPVVITYNIQDDISTGLSHSTTVNPGEITIDVKGRYFVSPQPQVGKTQGATGVDFDMFLQVDRGSGFVDEPDSNIKLTIKDQDVTDVIVSNFNLKLNAGDKIRLLQAVSDASVGMGLKNTDPVIGPPTKPRTPSIIFEMHRIGGF